MAPGRLEPGDVCDALREEDDAPSLELGPSGYEVVADHADVRDADLCDRGVARSGGTDSGRRILDQFEDTVVRPKSDDRGSDDHGRRDELAHVELDLCTLHGVGRRQHLQTQDL